MATTSLEPNTATCLPQIELQRDSTSSVVVLTGYWTLEGFAGIPKGALATLERNATEAADTAHTWDLLSIAALDTTGALILWRAWNRQLPAECRMREQHRRLFDYWIAQDRMGAPADTQAPHREQIAAVLAAPARAAGDALLQGFQLVGNLVLDTIAILRRPLEGPWRELSATIYQSGAKALPITALVGAMVGVVVSYLVALQLRNFGFGHYIVDMLGYAVIRELGPLIGAIIVAGRTGSAMTAQIGVMRLAQELDAMTSLGISISQRLIWPRVAALIVIMPFVVLWTILTGLAGGIAASFLTLDLGPAYFFTEMPQRVPVANLWIAIVKGLVFGAVIGVTAAYFGLRTKPNTRDLGMQTTNAVVAAITLVILIDATAAVLLEDVGF